MNTDPLKKKWLNAIQSITGLFKGDPIHIDPLEKKWSYVTLAMAGLFVGIIIVDALFHDINPPSNVETIDPASLHLSKEFAEDNLGVQVDESGNITVRIVAGRYGFYPKQITVPSGTPLTFRWSSMDVIHGIHLPMTNMSTMIVPGYISQLKTTFPKPGNYPLQCNEYCGMGHDHMWAGITVVAKEHWAAPAKTIDKGDSSHE
ncbi:MAG: cytochrome C oxidase subunit II [Methylobacter sp.]